MDTNLLLVLIAGVFALLYAFWKSTWIAKQDPGNEKMQQIGQAVREGAMAFLAREYKVLTIFVIAVAILSILLIAIYSTFILSHRAIEGMDESLLKNLETRKAIDILKRELDATVYKGSDTLTEFKIKDRDILREE